MMDRPRNRPRIAGQRRTASGPQDVTPATSEPSQAPVPEVEDSTSDTDSDEITALVAPDPKAEQAVQEPAQEAEPRGRLGVMLSATLGVLVVLVLVATVLLGIKAWQGKQAEDARDQAAAAGRKAAETVLSYDYRDLDKSFAASQAMMTPDYSGKFAETAKVVRELATKNKTTVRADVREVGVKDGDADRVTLIIFVNQTTTSTITKGVPRIDLNRTRFTMVRNGDQWLVQEIAGL